MYLIPSGIRYNVPNTEFCGFLQIFGTVLKKQKSRNNVLVNGTKRSTVLGVDFLNKQNENLITMYHAMHSTENGSRNIPNTMCGLVGTFLISAKMFLIPCVLWAISGTISNMFLIPK